MQFHYKPDLKTTRKPTARSPSDTLQPASLLGPPAADPGVFVVNNSVLAGQFDQNLLHQGLVSQAVLPASVSGERRTGRAGWGVVRAQSPGHASVPGRTLHAVRSPWRADARGYRLIVLVLSRGLFEPRFLTCSGSML